MLNHNRPRCFSNPQGNRGAVAGFTLLEVMIAVSVIAIALVTLVGAQSQSVTIATGARFDTVASLLAQQKVVELNLVEFRSLTGSEGDFGDAFPGFIWKTDVRELTDGDTGIRNSNGMLKVIDLTVSMERDLSRVHTVRTIVMQTIEPQR